MTAFTLPARRSQSLDVASVCTLMQLVELGISRSVIRANLRARRWQRVGKAVVTHNHEPSRVEWEQIALILCGPRSALTSFTAVERWGQTGWHREQIHVLVPEGARPPAHGGITVHRTNDWESADIVPARRLHRPAPALVIAAGSCANVRTACGVMAAGVQQRLVTVDALVAALEKQPKLRHFHALMLALYDMEQGARALSEIDFIDLCRRHGLPPPRQQSVREEPGGRRRYLDADWLRRDGGRLCAEVDGAMHLEALTWVGDQLRQNEIVLTGTPVLRFPTVVMRSDGAVVAEQLRRGLLLTP